MSTRAVSQRPESLRFTHQKDTVDTLAMAQERLDAINYDCDELASRNNHNLDSHPYEGVVLFGIDARPTDRASALLHASSYGMDRNERLNFFEDTIKDRRIILSQSALQASLQDGESNRYQTFHDSKMNYGNQIVWAQPLVHEGKNVAAVQLAFSINRTPNWNLPSNDGLDTIWQKHRAPMAEVARSIADLALKTSSLSKSLEIMPPVTPNAFVIQWDVVKSRSDALNQNYAKQEAYLETWKAAREEITKATGARILDRGDGEFIILPINQKDLNNDTAVRRYSKHEMLPIVDALVKKHAEIAYAYLPELFKKIKVTVGVGNIEEDQDGKPTGQVLYELKNLADYSTKSLVFSPAAEKILF
jgi:hypothetical protein